MKELNVTSTVSPLFLKLKLKGVTQRNFNTSKLYDRSEVSWIKPGIGLIFDRLILSGNLYVEENLFNFSNSKIDRILEKKLILGYFQSKTLVDSVHLSINSKIRNFRNFSNSQPGISLHIRGTDYLNNKNRTHHGNLSVDYYDTAINKIKENKKIPKTINVITDDVEYSTKLMKASEYFDKMKFEKNKNPWDDLIRLMQFDSVVLANSSFSWWAGYLAHKNFGAQIVIPKMWTSNIATKDTDLYYDEWTIV
jgi:hypothetical protein